MTGPGTPRGGRRASGERQDPPVRTVLFDLDGTLIDSRELILASYRHTMEVHLGGTPPDEAWLETMGTPLAAQLRDFARSAEEAEAMLDTYLEHNARVHDRLLRSFEGVVETLAWLRAAGYRIALVTSKRREGTLRGLRSCAIPAEWFGAVVTSDDPVDHKPSPDPLLLALERLGESSTTALFVGDTVWDLRSGRAAGTLTAAALWGSFEPASLEEESPDYLLPTIRDVRALLGDGDGEGRQVG